MTISLEKLKGILLPTTTPFDAAGELSTSAIRSNITSWIDAGVNGFVILGSTGERVHLSEREYVEVIENSRAVVPDTLPFIVGAGQQSTKGTIDEIKVAARAGADAVLVITPHFYRSAITQETLITFYRAIADAAEVPVLLYSMPALTGIKIEPETIAALSEHPNIVGVKDSSNEMACFAETRKLCPEEFAVMTGNGTVLFPALQAGATGGILAVGCVVPQLCLEIFSEFGNGNVEHCGQLQSQLTPLAAAVTTRFGIGGLKTALDFAGLTGGAVRSPLVSPGEAARDEIKNLLAAAQETQTVPV